MKLPHWILTLLLTSTLFGQTTPNLNLNIPTPGTQVNNWGTLLNNNFTALDNYLSGQSGYNLPALNLDALKIPSGLGAVTHILGPTDQPLQLATQSNQNINLSPNGTGIVSVPSGGGVTIGSPTGGAQGIGTLNATGLFVNGAATVNSASLPSTDFTNSGTATAQTWVWGGSSTTAAPTNANTANAIMKRDGSGDFIAHTAYLSGNLNLTGSGGYQFTGTPGTLTAPGGGQTACGLYSGNNRLACSTVPGGTTYSNTLLYQVSALQVPATPTVTYSGVAGAGTWDYKLVAFDAYGNQASAPSANGACSSAATTLDGSHTCTIPIPATWATFDANVATFNVYRTVSAGTPANLSLVCSSVALGGNCVDNGSVNTASVTPGVYVGTASLLTVFSYTVPGGVLGTGRCLRFKIDFAHSTGSAGVAYQALYGGTTAGNLSGQVATGQLDESSTVCNEPGSTQHQTIGLDHGTTSRIAEAAIDSTANQTWIWQFNVAATDQITPSRLVVEMVQ